MKRPLDEKLRAWWSHRQGLDGRLVGARPAEVLEQTGWARSVGGVGPYLTLFARGGASREAADEAVDERHHGLGPRVTAPGSRDPRRNVRENKAQNREPHPNRE